MSVNDGGARKYEKISRFSKYVVLILGVILTLKIVFDAYSYYVARRDIDAELRSKKVSSIEYLNVLAERERALAVITLEERCDERVRLALFRILDVGVQEKIRSAFHELVEQTNLMVETAKKLGLTPINLDKAVDFIDGPKFTLSELDKYLKVSDEVTNTDKYKDLMKEIENHKTRYIELGIKYKTLRDESEEFLKQNRDLGEINLRVAQIDQHREKRKELSNKIGELDDVMARYAVWIDALSGGTAPNPMLDEAAYQIRQNDNETLKSQNCTQFNDFYTMATGRVLEARPMKGKVWKELSWADRFGIIPRAYHGYLLRFFKQPPAAQTLLVTLFLGALGACFECRELAGGGLRMIRGGGRSTIRGGGRSTIRGGGRSTIRGGGRSMIRGGGRSLSGRCSVR